LTPKENSGTGSQHGDRIDIRGNGDSAPYDICHQEKQTTEPFPISDHKTTNLGGIVYLDVWGPYKITSKEGITLYLWSECVLSATYLINRLPSSMLKDLTIALSSFSLTPFEGGDFILEEIEAYLTSKSIPPGIDDTDLDLQGDIRLLEELLNNDLSSSPLPLKEFNVEEIKTVKSSIAEPPKLELKELPSHLEYKFLERTDKLPVIISKELKDEEKSALLKVLNSHKRAIAWKISDIKGTDPRFCTHKILMEDDFKLAVQYQRRVNLKFHEVIKKEVIKLLDAGLIYSVSDSLCMMAIFHDMIEETMVVFIDDFLVFGESFSSCLSHLDQMLKRCEDTNLVLNWEKCHFMVKEGTVLGRKISKSEIEVDRAKVDVIAKLPHPTSIKGV
nr:DNA-directed DNA polymerase [Tanacetum cinerariifolium]